MYRELQIHTTGFEGLLWYPVIFTGSLQGRITTQGDPCSHYREWVCSEVNIKVFWFELFLEARAEIRKVILLFVFWLKWKQENLLSKLIDLYTGPAARWKTFFFLFFLNAAFHKTEWTNVSLSWMRQEKTLEKKQWNTQKHIKKAYFTTFTFLPSSP